jgi:hypothetical protein
VDQQQLTMLFGGTVLAVFVAGLVIVFLQQRQITALTTYVKDVNANPAVLDLVESMATKVVPVAVATSALAVADLLARLVTNPDLKALLLELEKFGVNVTDNLPNTTTPGALVAPQPGSTVTITPPTTNSALSSDLKPVDVPSWNEAVVALNAARATTPIDPATGQIIAPQAPEPLPDDAGSVG